MCIACEHLIRRSGAGTPDAPAAAEPEYEVDKIVDHRGRGARISFRVRWKGYTPDEDTWETAAALRNAGAVLSEYTAALPPDTPEPEPQRPSRTIDHAWRDSILVMLADLHATTGCRFVANSTPFAAALAAGETPSADLKRRVLADIALYGNADTPARRPIAEAMGNGGAPPTPPQGVRFAGALPKVEAYRDFVDALPAEMTICAGCGVRDPDQEYSEPYALRRLPSSFFLVLPPAKVSQLNAMRTFYLYKPLADSSYERVAVHPRQLLSLFEDPGDGVTPGRTYRAVPEAVFPRAGTGEPLARLCRSCMPAAHASPARVYEHTPAASPGGGAAGGEAAPAAPTADDTVFGFLTDPRAPWRSAAGGADLGPGLASLPGAADLGLDASELEILVLAEQRAYYLVQKIVATQNYGGAGKDRLLPSFIVYPQAPTSVDPGADFDAQAIRAALQHVRPLFVGPEGTETSMEKYMLQHSPESTLRAHAIVNLLILRTVLGGGRRRDSAQSERLRGAAGGDQTAADALFSEIERLLESHGVTVLAAQAARDLAAQPTATRDAAIGVEEALDATRSDVADARDVTHSGTVFAGVVGSADETPTAIIEAIRSVVPDRRYALRSYSGASSTDAADCPPAEDPRRVRRRTADVPRHTGVDAAPVLAEARALPAAAAPAARPAAARAADGTNPATLASEADTADPPCLQRGPLPTNDYEGFASCMYGAWWNLFPLRQGLRAKVNDGDLRWLFLHHSNRFAQCHSLLFFCADRQTRHQVNSKVVASARKFEGSFDLFQRTVQSDAFAGNVAAALRSPTGEQATKLVAQVSKFLNLSCAAVPWHPREDAKKVALLFAQQRLRGASSLFINYAPYDTQDANALRWTCAPPRRWPAPRGEADVTCFDGRWADRRFTAAERQRLCNSNPIATTLFFHRQLRLIAKHLLRTDTRLKKDVADWARRPGIFGVATCFTACVESNERATQHAHAQLATGLAPALIAHVASDDDARCAVLAALDSQLDASACLDVHVAERLRKATAVLHQRDDRLSELPVPRGLQTPRPLGALPTPPAPGQDAGDAAWQRWATESFRAAAGSIDLAGEVAAVRQNWHDHEPVPRATCRKTKRGESGCRYCCKWGHDFESTRVAQLSVRSAGDVTEAAIRSECGVTNGSDDPTRVRCRFCYASRLAHVVLRRPPSDADPAAAPRHVQVRVGAIADLHGAGWRNAVKRIAGEDTQRRMALKVGRADRPPQPGQHDQRAIVTEIRRPCPPKPSSSQAVSALVDCFEMGYKFRVAAAKASATLDGDGPPALVDAIDWSADGQSCRDRLRRVITTDLRRVLDEPLFEGVGAALHGVVESDNDAAARRLLDLFASPGLHCANAQIGAYAKAFSAAVQCNAVVYPIGCGSGGIAASCYMAKYLKKANYNLEQSAMVLLDARRRVRTYPSTATTDHRGNSVATAAGQAAREALHFAQFVVRRTARELEPVQAAAIILQQPSFITTHNATSPMLNGYSVRAEAKNAAEDRAGTRGAARATAARRRASVPPPPAAPVELVDVGDPDTVAGDDGNAGIFQDDSEGVHAVQYPQHYRHRCRSLALLTAVEFNLLFELTKKTPRDGATGRRQPGRMGGAAADARRRRRAPATAASTAAPRGNRAGQGRFSNARYALQPPHPLANSHVLQKREKTGAVSFSRRPPTQPTASSAAAERHDYAAWCLANFVPWSHSDPLDLTDAVASWDSAIADLRRVAAKYTPDARRERAIAELLWAAKGKEVPEAAMYRRELAEVHGTDDIPPVVAFGRLFMIRNVTNGFHVPVQIPKLFNVYRERSRDLWDSAAGPCETDRQARGAAALARQQDAIDELLHAPVNTVQRLARCQAMQAFLGRVEAAAAPAYGEGPSPNSPAAAALNDSWPDAAKTGSSRSAGDLAQLQHAYAQLKKAHVGDDTVPGLAAAATADGYDRALASVWERPPPPELAEISERDFESLLHQYDCAIRDNSPANVPLNPRQRRVGRDFLKVVETCACARRHAQQQTISGHLANRDLASAMLVTGAAGVGKSAVIHEIRRHMVERGCGPLVVTAITGVAAAPFLGPTLLKTMTLGHDQYAEQVTPRPTKAGTYRARFTEYTGHKINDIGALVIDECSFLNEKFIAHLDQRLRDMTSVPAPFGGIGTAAAPRASPERLWRVVTWNHRVLTPGRLLVRPSLVAHG